MPASTNENTESLLRLRYAPLSPFARKVLVAAHETGTISKLDLVKADVWTEPTDIAADNPLGKIPALRTPYGILVNSALICDYLDQLNGAPRLIPTQPDKRWPILSGHAVADGVMEAAVLYTVERVRRPTELRWEGWTDRQLGKVDRSVDHLAEVCPTDAKQVDLFTITLGCALEYLDIRISTYDWRINRPHLSAWLKEFGERPSMTSTRPTVS